MAENFQKTSGRSGAYKLDRGNAPVESGPFIGEVRNNIDPTRSGRVQVWIEELAGPDKENSDLWRTVSYCSPFYGTTEQPGTKSGEGTFVANKHSYGMWFTPPDIGTQVICFFASGDPNQGYYLGSIIQPGLTHMVPAIGAARKYKLDNKNQSSYFSQSPQVPTIEINDANTRIDEDPRFYDQSKPVHSVVAGTMLQQGIINDTIRGPIGSNSQRESPSTVYGVSTPGRPVYAGGYSERDIKTALELGRVKPQDISVIARRGGHSLVMDDGDLEGNDQLVRLRTAKGHQILMSDSGDCFYFLHANGLTWIEMGAEGTVDVYSSNSINLRSQGDINIHADRNVNINAGAAINLHGKKAIQVETEAFALTANKSALLYSNTYLGIKTDGTLSLDSSKAGTWNGGGSLSLSAGCINLNGGSAPPVPKPPQVTKYKLPDVKFMPNKGWVAEAGKIETVVNRAPTHEPYPFHGRGVGASVALAPVSTVAFGQDVSDRLAAISDTSFPAITTADYVTEPMAEISIGSIEPEQVTGMVAQASKLVPQDFNEISNDYGVGKFGFSAQQLEVAGYLKPGTVEFYLSDGTASLETVLSSPSVWTGQNGVTSLVNVLNDANLQNNMQISLYNIGLQQLRATGLVVGNELPDQLAGLVQAASKYGPRVVKSWVDGTIENEELLADLNARIRSTQYAINLVQQKVPEPLQGYSVVGSSAANTVNRSTIDKAVESVIDNPKVQSPDYSPPTDNFSGP